MKNNNTKIPDLLLIIITIIWGSGFVATQMAIDANMSASVIMSFRFSVASIVMFVVFRKKLRGFTKSEIFHGALTGIILYLGFLFQTIGLKYTTPSNNAFITTINVVMVPFITWLILRKRPKIKIFIAAIFSFIGISVLTYSGEGGIFTNIGDILTLICAVMFACHIAYLGYAAKKVNAQKLTFLQLIVAAIMSLTALLLFDNQALRVVDYDKGLLPVIYLGLFCTCIAFYLQTYAQVKTSPGKAAVILSMEAVFGSLFSVIMGLEGVTARLIIGGFIVMSSIMLLEINFKKRQEINGIDD